MIQARDDYDVGSRVVQEVYGAADHQQRVRAAPHIINVDTVATVHRPRVFSYRGRVFRITHVSWREGLALEYLDAEIQSRLKSGVTDRQTLLELEALFMDAHRIMWRLTDPDGLRDRWRRWRGRYKDNPFTRTTVAEYSALVHFFFECQMLLSDLALGTTPDSIPTETQYRSILPTAWPRLSKHSGQVGSTLPGNPSVTSIFGLGFGGWKFHIRARP